MAKEQTRLIQITEANVRQSHIYLNGALGLFPRDSFGASSKKKGLGRAVQLDVEGFAHPILTDIPRDAKTGRPRGIFRKRSWVAEFFRLHGIRGGETVAIEKTAERRYAIRPERPAHGFTAAEFFAGIGLVRLALERQGFRVVFANDIDPAKQEMYVRNFGSEHFKLGDIHKLDPSEVPECDLFTASFPCNDLSIAGAWAGLNGKESSAFWGLIDILKRLGNRRPPLVLLENVVGFLQAHRGKDFETALLALNELGYSVDAFILNAVRWVPQSRARLFVVATLGERASRIAVALQSDTRPDPLAVFINTHQHIRWNIRGLPKPPEPHARLESILDDLPDDDPHWWSRERAQYFVNQLSERHLKLARAMIAGDRTQFATAFRRVRNGRSMAELRTDGVAGCLRTPRGGSGRQILFVAGSGRYRVRLLTARECARLQGVPDTYEINVPLNQALFGFGDAVCVPALAWIASEYLAPVLADIRREPLQRGRIA